MVGPHPLRQTWAAEKRHFKSSPHGFFGATVPCIHPSSPLHFDKICVKNCLSLRYRERSFWLKGLLKDVTVGQDTQENQNVVSKSSIYEVWDTIWRISIPKIHAWWSQQPDFLRNGWWSIDIYSIRSWHLRIFDPLELHQKPMLFDTLFSKQKGFKCLQKAPLVGQKHVMQFKKLQTASFS